MHCVQLAAARSGYPVAIVYFMDQRYYEALKGDHMTLLSIYLEAVQTTAESEMRVYEEAVKAPPKKPRKKPGTGN